MSTAEVEDQRRSYIESVCEKNQGRLKQREGTKNDVKRTVDVRNIGGYRENLEAERSAVGEMAAFLRAEEHAAKVVADKTSNDIDSGVSSQYILGDDAYELYEYNVYARRQSERPRVDGAVPLQNLHVIS